MEPERPAGSSRLSGIPLPLTVLLAAELVFLVGAHYVKAYSDPCLWLTLGERWLHGQPIGPWAPLYPVFLGCCLKWLGRIQVFWVNTPLVLGLTGLLCLLTARSLPGERASPRRTLAAVLAAVLFVVLNRPNLLELQNPYREALAFCLLVSGLLLLLSFLEGGGLWRPALSAALIGLATGVRETCGLLLVPALLGFLWRGPEGAAVPRGRGLAVFLGTLVLGLLPFLIHNAVATGRFWIPAYALQKWMSVFSPQAGGFDIPIPGMSLEHVGPTGRRLLAYLLAKYSPAGVLLLGVGIASAVVRRNRAVLSLFLPAVAINLLFYSFWHTVSWRLALVIDLTAIPIMAVGAVALFDRVAVRLNPGQPERAAAACRCAAWAMAGAAALSLLYGAAQHRDRLKTWQVAELQEFVRPRLDPPAALAGRGHATQMLGWLLDLPFVDLEQAAAGSPGIDGTLAEMGARNLALVRASRVYVHGSEAPPLLSQWFDIEPGPSLADPPVPLETYGRPLRGDLLRVVPWTDRAIRQTVRIARPGGDALLMVDAGRVWDYPGRTFCRVQAGSVELSGSLSNGPTFFVVDRAQVRDGSLEVRIDSDGPLPARAHVEAHEKNGELGFPLGFRTNGWFYPLAPSGFTCALSGPSGGFGLFRQGEMRLPKFCDASFEMLVELRWTAGAPSGPPARVAIAGRHDALETASSGRAPVDRAVLSLGPGGGGLEWEPLRWELHASHTWIRVLDARLFPVPFKPAPSVRVDVGSAGDAEYLIEGFYRPEAQGQGRTVRWSSARSRIRLPVDPPGRALSIAIRCFHGRPPEHPPLPRFRVNDWAVPQDSVRAIADGSDEGVVYGFDVPREKLRNRGSQMLELTCTPWMPARTGHGRDSRPLGIRVDSVEARSL